MKLGLNPRDRSLRVVALSDHMDRATTWPAVPPYGWEYAPGATGNGLLDPLGNDTVGCCALADAHHYAVADTAAVGRPLKATRDLCLADYSAVTGYDPAQTDSAGNNPTDQGTTYAQLFDYWQKTGLTLLDAVTGEEVKHTIRGAAALDLTSVAQMRYAASVFGGLHLGINCPQSWIDNTTNWNSAAGPVAGGHAVPLLGQGSAGWHTDSWGVLIPGTWAAAQQVAYEGYIVVSDFWLDAMGKSPSGVDMDTLLADMEAL